MPDCVYNIVGSGPYDGYYCTKKYTGDNSETDFSFPFPYLGLETWDGEKSRYIKCWLNGVESTAFTMPEAQMVRFTTAPGANVCIMIRRDSDLADRKVDFESGSRHTAAVENRDSQNAFYLIQELADQLYDATLNQSDSDNRFNLFQWEGDGTTRIFPMSTDYGPADETGITNEAEVEVGINAAIQEPQEAYTLQDIGGITNVVFPSGHAPPSGFRIWARTMTSGTAQHASVQDGSITCAKLADDAITTACWDRIMDIDDMGTDREVFIWDEESGGAELNVRQLTHDDISDFDSGVRAGNRPNQLATCNGNLNLGSNKIVSLANGTASTDGINKGQLDSAIATVTGSNSTAVISGVPGSITVSGLGFAPTRVEVYWVNVVFTVDGHQHDICHSVFGAGTGTETRRGVAVDISDGADTSITHQLQFQADGFTYTVPTQNGGNYSGTIRYIAHR